MLAEQIAAGPTAQSPLDERLDAFDRVLIGVDSRSEQRALVGALEARLRSAGGSCAEPLTDFGLAAVPTGSPLAHQSSAPALSYRPRRSKLALSSGILGIVACVLLVGSPAAYILATVLGQHDSTIAHGALVGFGTMVLLGGGGAMVLGAVALWRLRQRQSEFVGSGWAITGLCTGPIPFGVASIVGIAVGLPMLSSVNVEIDEVAESSYDQSESAAESDSGFRSYRRTTKLVDAAIEKAFKVLIGEFNHLCRAKRFDEAMVIAKLARLLRPDDELAEYMVVKARRGGNERLKKRRIDEFGQCLISYESDSTEE